MLQNFIFHSSAGWKVQDQSIGIFDIWVYLLVTGNTLLLHTHSMEGSGNLSQVSLIKALILGDESRARVTYSLLMSPPCPVPPDAITLVP